jgi:hypothetical protein
MDNNPPRLTLAKLDELINAVEGGATVLWTPAGDIPVGSPVAQMTYKQLIAALKLAARCEVSWAVMKERLERRQSITP